MVSSRKALRSFVETKVQHSAVLVVGDVMLDKYYFGEVRRISPEAPVPVTRVTKEKETLGGAANVAHNLALLGVTVFLAGVTGQDIHRDSLVRLLTEKGVDTAGLVQGNGPTVAKLRIIGGHQQMLRLDFEETTPISAMVEAQVMAYVTSCVPEKAAAVIISDYGKGVCTPSLCQSIISYCEQHNIPAIIDPKGIDWTKYSGAHYITPNLKELGEALGLQLANCDEQVTQAAQRLKRKYHIKNVVVTRSEKGLSIIAPRQCVHIPTYAQEVFDVSGAGDTVIAVLGAALASGMKLSDAAYLANRAAGVVVGKLGTYAISHKELMAEITRKDAD